jgi:PAS domain S-box-containing protein
MDDPLRQITYYRRRLDELGSLFLQAQDESGRARRQAERARMAAALIRDGTRLSAASGAPEEYAGAFLRVVADAMRVDRAMLLEYDGKEACFVVRAALGGVPNDPPRRIQAGQLGCFHVGNARQAADGAVEALRGCIGAPHVLWLFDPGAGWALLVGNDTEDRRLHPPFEVEDREIVEAALSTFVETRRRILAEAAIRGTARLFYELGPDCRANIDAIVRRACALLDGAAALYNRLDARQESLTVWSGHQLPTDMAHEDAPAGHICYEATIRGQDQTIAIANLDETPYRDSDPNVARYGLKAYLGHPVHLRGKAVGSLAVVDTQPRVFDERETNTIVTLARALSLEEERLATQERNERINRVLAAVRNVNQLIVEEKSGESLIRKTCQLLVDARGYHTAWIALFDEHRRVTAACETGLGCAFEPLRERLRAGDFPLCARRALARAGVATVDDPAVACAACALATSRHPHSVLSVRLEHDGVVHGVLSVSVPAEYAHDEEEHGLLRELAGDIAFALFNIQQEARKAQAESDLRDSAARYRGLVESQRDLIVRVDTAGRFLFANDAYCAAFGQDRQALLGRTFMPLVHPDDLAATQDAMRGLEEPPYRIYVEQRARTIEGWRWLGWEDSAIKNERGETVEIQGTGRDITLYKETEKALRDSEARSRALLAAMPDLMFVQSPDGVYLDYHAPARGELAAPPQAFLGRNMREVLPAEVIERFVPRFEETLRTGRVQRVQYSMTVDGEERFFEARTVGIEDGNVLTIVRNVTDVARADREIRNALERERELSELKTRFVSAVSHEFRTPLAAILSSAELIERMGAKLTEERKRRYVDQIRFSARHMTSLLDDILLIGRMDAGKVDFNPAPVDLDGFCRALVEEANLIAADGCAVQYSVHGRAAEPGSGAGAEAWVDVKLLRQILYNLLSNAIKFSLPGGAVRFDLRLHPDRAEFCIADQGIGIPVEEQPRLFESFFRASNAGVVAGTGLGLSIAKRSVDLHGGEMRCVSGAGQGATFTVTLPLRAPGAQGHAES